MSIYAQTQPIPPTAAPFIPWSLIGRPEPPSATTQQQAQFLFGWESQPSRGHEHEARLEGKNLDGQDLAQQDTKRSDANFAVLSGFYSVRNPSAVRDFLVGRRPLFKLLFAALPKVKETWGRDAKSELELLHDPEDDSYSLVVHVLSSHPDAYAALDRFDEQWWLGHISASEGLLNFSVEP